MNSPVNPSDTPTITPDQESASQKKKSPLNFLGIFEIERRSDILAFAALLISLGSITAQGINMIKGPQVEMQAVDQVLLTSETYNFGKEKREVLTLIGKMVYLNHGSPGYDDILKTESVEVTVSGQPPFTLHAQEYVKTSKQADGSLKVEVESDAIPARIKSGDVLYHETYFQPRVEDNSNKNYVALNDFIRNGMVGETVEFTFTATTVKGETFKRSCKLIAKRFAPHLIGSGLARPWTTQDCVKSDK